MGCGNACYKSEVYNFSKPDVTNIMPYNLNSVSLSDAYQQNIVSQDPMKAALLAKSDDIIQSNATPMPLYAMDMNAAYSYMVTPNHSFANKPAVLDAKPLDVFLMELKAQGVRR